MHAPERVVVIDDDESFRRSLSRFLASAGFTVECADNPKQGLDLLTRSSLPGAVILDFYMPVQCGDDALGELRAKYPHLPVLVVSSVVTERNYARLVALGATDCIPKADVDVALIPKLRNLLAARRLKSQLSHPISAESRVPARASYRYPIALPVSVKAESWDQYAVLYTGDVSGGGLFIRMADPCPVGTPLRVRLGLPDGQIIEVGAEVVNVVAPVEGAHPKRAAGIGVRFVDWTVDQRAALGHFLNDLSAMHAREQEEPADGQSWNDARVGEQSEAGGSLAPVLRGHLADLRECDYFSVLGVSLETDPSSIRSAFLKLVKHWHPSKFALQTEEIRDLVTEIFLVIKRAFDALSHAQTRDTYRTRLRLSGKLLQATLPPLLPPSRAQQRIPELPGTDSVDRDLELGEQLLSSGQFGAARQAFERALKRAPDDLKLKANHAYASAQDVLQRNLLDEATHWLETSLQADSHFQEAIHLLRQVKEQQRQAREGFLQRFFGEA